MPDRIELLTADQRAKLAPLVAGMDPVNGREIVARVRNGTLGQRVAARIVAGEELVDRLMDLLFEIVSSSPCRYGRHGGCDTHDRPRLGPDEICPHEDAKTLLAAYDRDGSEQ